MPPKKSNDPLSGKGLSRDGGEADFEVAKERRALFR
jgi:hypothetical protein